MGNCIFIAIISAVIGACLGLLSFALANMAHDGDDE